MKIMNEGKSLQKCVFDMLSTFPISGFWLAHLDWIKFDISQVTASSQWKENFALAIPNVSIS